MGIPNINIWVDTCNTCNRSTILPVTSGGCGCVQPVTIDTSPNDPCHTCDDVCIDLYKTDCVYYNTADIPNLGIKQNDKLTSVLIKMASEIIDLKRRLLAANIPI